MPVDLLRALSSKRVDIIVIGTPLAPERAAEIIARTDSGFGPLRYSRIDDRVRSIRAAVGLPPHVATPPGTRAVDDPVADAALTTWRRTWGSIDPAWLGNNQLLAGAAGVAGWCHPDGQIAYADEIEDYPMATEIHDDCWALAQAFPDLAMAVIAWGGHGRIMDAFLGHTPRAPWPAALRDSVHPPRVGFRIGDGNVQVFDGDDPRLLAGYASDIGRAVETALETVRRGRETHDLPDTTIALWKARAQRLRLA